jgi:predicted GIY-YIG superfamily endonuclease
VTAGIVYLLHFDRSYRHARHYLGWTTDLAARLAEHARGQGARLLAVVREAGIGWRLARTWPGTRRRERQIKNQGGASRCCPLCGVRPRTPAAPVPAAAPPAVPLAVASRPSAYDRGAATAARVIGEQVAAGFGRDRIEAADRRRFAHYDPASARPVTREWHCGWTDTAAALLAVLPAAASRPPSCRDDPGARLCLTALVSAGSEPR